VCNSVSAQQLCTAKHVSLQHLQLLLLWLLASGTAYMDMDKPVKSPKGRGRKVAASSALGE
jgi:hypothetical protein